MKYECDMALETSKETSKKWDTTADSWRDGHKTGISGAIMLKGL